jgi:opacity protein-like surface antigen
MFKRGLILVALMMATGTTLWAYERDLGGPAQAGRVSLGGRGMYFDPEGHADGSWSGGAQLRMHFTKVFAVEGSADYRETDHPGTKVKTYPVQASLLAYLLPESRLSPFLLAGAGWYFTEVEGPFGYDETEHRFGPHLGGGLQYFLSQYVSVDGTYRYVWVEDVNSRDNSLLEKEYDDSGHMITAALNFHF